MKAGDHDTAWGELEPGIKKTTGGELELGIEKASSGVGVGESGPNIPELEAI